MSLALETDSTVTQHGRVIADLSYREERFRTLVESTTQRAGVVDMADAEGKIASLEGRLLRDQQGLYEALSTHRGMRAILAGDASDAEKLAAITSELA